MDFKVNISKISRQYGIQFSVVEKAKNDKRLDQIWNSPDFCLRLNLWETKKILSTKETEFRQICVLITVQLVDEKGFSEIDRGFNSYKWNEVHKCES